MSIQSIRFLELPYESGGPDKSYDIQVDDNHYLDCELSRKRVWEPVTFSHQQSCTFQLSPERKLLNRNWTLTDSQGNPVGKVEVVDAGCRCFSTDGEQLFQLVDPRRWQEKLIETALNSWPDRYVIAVQSEEVGQIARRPRDGEPEPQTRIQKLRGLLKTRDWAAVFQPPLTLERSDLLVAGMLLLIEVVVRGKRS